MLIGLMGQIGSGKGTAADFLVSKGFKKDSFAAPLKDSVSAIFNWDREMLEGETSESRVWREQEDEYWSEVFNKRITPRNVLQVFGTDIVRNNFHKNIWVESFIKRYKDNPIDTVVADVRFPNEMQTIKKLGGKLYRIKRGEDPKWMSYVKEVYYKGLGNSNLSNIVSNVSELVVIKLPHKSEWAWLEAESLIDEVIDNSGTLKEFNQKINQIITQL